MIDRTTYKTNLEYGSSNVCIHVPDNLTLLDYLYNFVKYSEHRLSHLIFNTYRSPPIPDDVIGSFKHSIHYTFDLSYDDIRIEQDVAERIAKWFWDGKIDYILSGHNDYVISQLTFRYKVPRERIIVPTFGYLPYHKNIFLSLGGPTTESLLTNKGNHIFRSHEIYHTLIELSKKELETGKEIEMENYVYVPLQVETEHRIRYSPFETNRQFLEHLDRVIPKEYDVLVKSHPMTEPYNRLDILSISDRFVDITDKGYSVASIMRNMEALASISSTAILEALMFDKPVFAYGPDIFSNKGIVFENVNSQKNFGKIVEEGIVPSKQLRLRFISYLMNFQLEKSFIYKDESEKRQIVKDHYVNNLMYQRGI